MVETKKVVFKPVFCWAYVNHWFHFFLLFSPSLHDFSTLTLLVLWTREDSLWWQWSAVLHTRILHIISGLCPLDASSTSPTPESIKDMALKTLFRHRVQTVQLRTTALLFYMRIAGPHISCLLEERGWELCADLRPEGDSDLWYPHQSLLSSATPSRQVHCDASLLRMFLPIASVHIQRYHLRRLDSTSSWWATWVPWSLSISWVGIYYLQRASRDTETSSQKNSSQRGGLCCDSLLSFQRFHTASWLAIDGRARLTLLTLLSGQRPWK